MRRTFKVGFGLMCAGLLVWGIPTIRNIYPTQIALTAPLPLLAGGVLHEKFDVLTSERYSIDLACQEVGQFKEAWKDFLNWKQHPTLDCDITLRLLHDGQEIHSEHLHSLEPASWSAGTAFWSMARLELPSSGRYELLVTNHSDISNLQPTAPTIRVQLNGYDMKNRGLSSLLGLALGAPMLLIGLLMCVRGFFRSASS